MSTIYKTIQIEKKKTVSKLLEELKINKDYFAVLINGKSAALDQTLFPEDKILILPKIKGGSDGLI